MSSPWSLTLPSQCSVIIYLFGMGMWLSISYANQCAKFVQVKFFFLEKVREQSQTQSTRPKKSYTTNSDTAGCEVITVKLCCSELLLSHLYLSIYLKIFYCLLFLFLTMP